MNAKGLLISEPSQRQFFCPLCEAARRRTERAWRVPYPTPAREPALRWTRGRGGAMAADDDFDLHIKLLMLGDTGVGKT